MIDTNIWLETLLEQERAPEAREFLRRTDAIFLAISEFSLYSIGLILTRLQKDTLFLQFVSDALLNANITRIRLSASDFVRLSEIRQRYDFDFDDAYQYVAAEKYNLILVSFDSDFDRTERGRKTPAEILKK